MKLSDWREGINISIKNILRLYDDATLLLKNRSYGHACFFLITAFEEVGVAYYILDRFDNPEPEGLKNFLDHFKKMALASFKMIPYIINQSEIYIEFLKVRKRQILGEMDNTKANLSEKSEKRALKLGSQLRKKNSLWYFRNHSLYIELNEALSQFTSPEEINREVAISLKTFMDLVKTMVQVDRDMSFKFGSDSEELKQYELGVANSMIKLFNIFKILQEGAIDKLLEFPRIKPEYKDFLTNLILKPELINIKSNPEIIKKLLIILFEELALHLEDLLKKEEIGDQFEYLLKRMVYYDKKIAHFYRESFRMMDQIAKGKLNLESFSKFFGLNNKKK